jgi:uncharacterized protein YndB with AHSA1/START domain
MSETHESPVEASDMQASETTLRLERLFAAPPELLFALWTEPTELVRWWAPDGYEALLDVFDLSPGGRWRTVLRRPGDGNLLAISGVYRAIEPPRRLSFSWAWEDERGARGHETEVSVSFEPTLGGTRLVLLQQRFESRPARDGHHTGWSACFDRLAAMTA